MQIETIQQAIQGEFPQTVQYRRYFHENPRLSFQEEDTAAYIRKQLMAVGLTCISAGQNGIVTRISGNRPGPCIAFRADFDALAIEENTGLPFTSHNPGVMHACGHDGHAAILLSMARIFAQHREMIAGEVVLIFQYAEELPPGGAAPMTEAGCLAGVERIYGLHVSEDLETGVIGICPGKYMAASDGFFIDFLGDGGHGSRPGDTQDTVSAAVGAISQINTIISRFISPLRVAVISVCNIHGGASYNIIPGKVRLEGTVRTYEAETAQLIREKLESAAKTAAEMYGTRYQFKFEFGYPALINHQRESQVVRQGAEAMGLTVADIDPTPVGEDFARYLQQIPGAFFRVGIRNPAKNAVYSLHSRRFNLDEDGLLAGLQAFAGIYLTETEQI